MIEGPAEVVAFLEDRLPTEAGLHTLQYKELEKKAVAMLRHSPLHIMVGDRDIALRPRTTFQLSILASL